MRTNVHRALNTAQKLLFLYRTSNTLDLITDERFLQMTDFAHVSFTAPGRRADPWKLLDAARRWHPIASRTIPCFDVGAFQEQHGIANHSAPRAATEEAVLSVINDRQFRKGPEANARHASGFALRKIAQAIRTGSPIEIVLPSFAGRPHNPAAHRRVAPDLGELYALQRLKNISDAVRGFYEPGIVFTLILDGRAYRPFYGYSDQEAMAYGPNLERQIDLLGARGQIRTVDMHDLMASRRDELEGIDSLVRHEVRRAWDSGEYLFKEHLIHALRQGTETTPISAALVELYKSGSANRIDVVSFFREAENVITERAEHTAFEYAVLMTKLRKVNLIGTAFRHALRGTVHPKLGQYSPQLADPSTTISPWHGVAIVRRDLRIVTEYESVVYEEFDSHTAVFVSGDEAPFFYEATV
jgi:L-tyrosine isonitrile synthase